MNNKKIACVTGASGMIGRRIVARLLAAGYHVRVLTRREYAPMDVEVFKGGLADIALLEEFFTAADLVFHCAAELRDPTRMEEVNIRGTENIIKLVEKHHVGYFCYLSSAGVVGSTNEKWVHEDTPCAPQNAYERSKHAAELLVRRAIPGCTTIILRPTNVIDENHLGELRLAINGSWKSLLLAILKGGECAHIVHADDVARAALHFIGEEERHPRIYFVGLDEDPLNTVASLWKLGHSGISKNTRTERVLPHLPIHIPYLLRRLSSRHSNLGDVRYSSERLCATGFKYSLDVARAVSKILQDRYAAANVHHP